MSKNIQKSRCQFRIIDPSLPFMHEAVDETRIHKTGQYLTSTGGMNV